MALLRILGVGFSLAVVVGGSIGSGIVRSPGLVAMHAGSEAVALGVWALACAFALVGAMCLSELATAVPKSGGFYVFARRALGDGFGAVVGGADWLANCAALTYVAVTAAEYVGRLVPSALGYQTALAGSFIVVIACLLLLGMRMSSRLQEAASFLKAAGFMVLVAALLASSPASETTSVAASGGLPGLVSLALALQLATGACDGWQNGAYFAGEDRDPARNLPRGIIGGVAVVSGVYLLLNVAISRALPLDQLAASQLPAADAAASVFGQQGLTAVTLLAIWSPLSGISVTLMSAPRILYAMGTDGLLPSRLSFVDTRGTPRTAMAWSAAAAVAFLPLGGFESVATVFAIFAIASYIGGFVSLLVLRLREPELPRPFKAWGYPWTILVVLAGNAALLGGIAVGAPLEAAVAALALAASYPLYRLTRTR